ncbi:MAG TPA: YoaK family protein [Spirillospora sp.]|nr:YoaK family protein [Spirillospora sp.]
MVAAATDVVSYLGLGHVFTANMTGNTALLGIGIATGATGAALRSLCALGAFVLGAFAGGLLPSGRRLLASCLAVELVPLAAWYIWWDTLGGPAHGAPRFGYIALAGAAMGLQAGAVTRLGVSGVTTVFITGTMTSLVVDLSTRLHGDRLPNQSRIGHFLQALVLAFFLAGAVATGFAFKEEGSAAVLIPLFVLAAVVPAAYVLPPVDEPARD